MKRLYFVRHGLSQANVDELWGGHTDSLLVDEGRAQAALAGEKIKSEQITIDLIIASPLLRTQETARVIAERIGYPVQQIVTEDLIIERNFGSRDGTATASFFEELTYQDMDTVENAETIEAMHDRAVRALVSIQSRNEENILLVSHGSFGRALRRVVNKRPHTDEYTTADWGAAFIKNGELIRFI